MTEVLVRKELIAGLEVELATRYLEEDPAKLVDHFPNVFKAWALGAASLIRAGCSDEDVWIIIDTISKLPEEKQALYCGYLELIYRADNERQAKIESQQSQDKPPSPSNMPKHSSLHALHREDPHVDPKTAFIKRFVSMRLESAGKQAGIEVKIPDDLEDQIVDLLHKNRGGLSVRNILKGLFEQELVGVKSLAEIMYALHNLRMLKRVGIFPPNKTSQGRPTYRLYRVKEKQNSDELS